MAEISWKRKPGQKLAPLAERLKKLGLVSDWDFVLHLPLRYEDETSITPIENLKSASMPRLKVLSPITATIGSEILKLGSMMKPTCSRFGLFTTTLLFVIY